MKLIVLLVALTIGMVFNANATGIYTSVSEVNGNTVVSCIPFNTNVDITRARIFLYVSNGVSFETGIQPMEVSYENIASYELPGTYDVVEGRCKFIMMEEDNKVTREEFIVSMR